MIKNMGILDEKKLRQEEETAAKDMSGGWHRDVCQGILMAYFLVMAVIYPFYVPGGYMRIGEVKFEFFRNISLVTLAVMAVMIMLSIVVRRDGEWLIRNYRGMSVTDWFAYGYFVVVMLSYLCSGYKEGALWGVQGWYMGVITQIIFVFLYFLFSRYFHCDIRWVGIWLAAASIVFVLGICNRYSVYPIVMEGQTETFISTLGNINWFCGYWSVIAPMGITMYWCSDKVWVRILTAIYSIIAMLSGVTQGSNSAYLVFIILLLALFVLSLGSRERLYRFVELCMLFAAGCLAGKFMLFLPNLQYNYTSGREDGMSCITTALLTGNTALWILVIALICYILLRVVRKHCCLNIQSYMGRYIQWKVILSAAVITIACIAAVILLLASGVFYGGKIPQATDDNADYRQIFDDSWGNGRGAAWNCGINAYRSMDTLHKIVGVGSDCFADYVYDVPELAGRLAEQFVNQRLTNAHNEYVTLLVNTGVLGLLCYAGLFLIAFVRYVRRASGQPLLYLCAVSILTYTVHNMVSFQQVLSTPFVFIVLGIGERVYRSTAKGSKYEHHDSQCGQ